MAPINLDCACGGVGWGAIELQESGGTKNYKIVKNINKSIKTYLREHTFLIEQNRRESNRIKQNQTESSRIEQNRTESNRIEQNRTESNRGGKPFS